MLYGTGFRHHCPRGDGTAFEIVGEPRGGAAWLSIRPASEEARALRDTEAALARAGAELRFLRDVLDRAPVLAWSQGPDGQVAWANAPYRDRFDAAGGRAARPPHRRRLRPRARGGAADRPRRRQPPPGRGARPRRRRAALVRAQPRPRRPAGETLGFALAADDLVAAEASLCAASSRP